MLVLISLFSFLLGAIPFGVLIGKLYNIDLTQTGSGNTGATNVARTLGMGPAILVFSLDFLKGTLSALIAYLLIGTSTSIGFASFFAILGHMYSPYLNFKGGKGVATGIGAMLVIAPDIFFISFATWIIIFSLKKYVSLASIIVAGLTIILMIVFRKPLMLDLAVIACSALVLYKHSPNMKRLLEGTENSFKK